MFAGMNYRLSSFSSGFHAVESMLSRMWEFPHVFPSPFRKPLKCVSFYCQTPLRQGACQAEGRVRRKGAEGWKGETAPKGRGGGQAEESGCLSPGGLSEPSELPSLTNLTSL